MHARASISAMSDAEGARCRAVVVACIDWRFVEVLRRHLEAEGLVGAYDPLHWPGGGLALAGPDAEGLFGVLALAQRLHDPDRIVLVAHRDCGRLGGSATFPDHAAETSFLDNALAHVRELVRERFPDLEVGAVRLEPDAAVVVAEDLQADPAVESQLRKRLGP